MGDAVTEDRLAVKANGFSGVSVAKAIRKGIILGAKAILYHGSFVIQGTRRQEHILASIHSEIL